MKTRELRYVGGPSRSDCDVLEGRRVSVSRLASYSPYLDCRTDGEASAKREISDFPVPNQRGLQDLFDLTAAEAKLAQLLACGDSIDEVAQKLNIKMSTARTQLAAVFSKTDTRRQAKLVALLGRIAHLEKQTRPLPLAA